MIFFDLFFFVLFSSGETLSRRSSVSHLTHEVMSSFGSYTSLSFRSTPGGGGGGGSGGGAGGTGDSAHKTNRHSPRQHSHSHYHRHHNHNHHYHGQNSSRKHQVYYQTHHALCKRAFSGESHGKWTHLISLHRAILFEFVFFNFFFFK